MAHHVIYVPGLGDHVSHGQNLAIQLWRLYGVKPHYFPLKWAKKEKFDTKLDRLLEKIDGLLNDGHSVSLVGVSAGASAVINAYAARTKLNAVVSIVGKIHRPESIGNTTYRINPAFKESMNQVCGSLEKISTPQRKRIMSIYVRADRTVPNQDSLVDGALNKKFLGWGHISGIFFSVVLGGPLIANFIKKSK